MGIIEVVMAYFGFLGTSISIVGAIGDAIRNSHNYSAEELFKRCFKRAVKRRSIHLADLTSKSDHRDIRVDDNSIELVFSDLNLIEPKIIPTGEKEEFLKIIAPKFKKAIVIPNFKYDDKRLVREISFVLSDALSDFFEQLPLSDRACKEIIVASIKAQSLEQASQEQFRVQVEEQLRRMVATQENVAKSLSYLDPTVIQKESGRPEYRNPFRIVKAEEFDHNYPLLADLFRQPENYELIRGRDNLILYGARGCGKSMILRSLEAPAAIEIECRTTNNRDNLTFTDSGLDYLGIYVKLAKGYFDDWSPDSALSMEAATQLFQHVFNLLLLKATIEALLAYRDRDNIISFTAEIERSIAEKILIRLGGIDIDKPDFSELRKVIIEQERDVGTYLGRLRLGNKAEYAGELTYVNDFPREFCRVILDSIPDLQGARIYFLLDEFENLAEFQQTVVNTITKLRPDSLTTKVATRATGLKSIVDLQGEPIQSPRDYKMVSLDYDVSKSNYADLLFQISKKRLRQESCAQDDIRKLLPTSGKYPEFGEERIKELLSDYLKLHRGIEVTQCTEPELKEWLHRMDLALTFREAAAFNRRYPKHYSGFQSFVDISSGIISNYLELCKMAFYLAESEGINVRNGEPISSEIQTEAFYLVSRVSLDWIPRNIPKNGPKIARLVLDLADIFREKLLKHNTEPEAARIIIADPEQIDEPQFDEVESIMIDAIRWSVFHAVGPSTAYLPKHKSDVRPDDYRLNRILAPILRISPRPRWRTEFKVKDIAALLSTVTRKRKKAELMKKHSGQGSRSRKTRIGTDENQPSLPFGNAETE